MSKPVENFFTLQIPKVIDNRSGYEKTILGWKKLWLGMIIWHPSTSAIYHNNWVKYFLKSHYFRHLFSQDVFVISYLSNIDCKTARLLITRDPMKSKNSESMQMLRIVCTLESHQNFNLSIAVIFWEKKVFIIIIKN